MTQNTTSPFAELRNYGIEAGEGETFTVKYTHGLQRLQEVFESAVAKLPEGHGWRLSAVFGSNRDSHGKSMSWRCMIGRVDVWPYPSHSEASKADEVRDPVMDSLRLARSAAMAGATEYELSAAPIDEISAAMAEAHERMRSFHAVSPLAPTALTFSFPDPSYSPPKSRSSLRKVGMLVLVAAAVVAAFA